MENWPFWLSEHAQRRISARQIRLEWIGLTLMDPDRTEPDQLDPTLKHAMKKIAAMDDRVLRVIYNQTVDPPRVVSAYFDRGMRGKL